MGKMTSLWNDALGHSFLVMVHWDSNDFAIGSRFDRYDHLATGDGVMRINFVIDRCQYVRICGLRPSQKGLTWQWLSREVYFETLPYVSVVMCSCRDIFSSRWRWRGISCRNILLLSIKVTWHSLSWNFYFELDMTWRSLSWNFISR